LQASGRQHPHTSAEPAVRLTAPLAGKNSMIGHKFDAQLSLDRLPELLSERFFGASGTDLSASLLRERSRTEDLRESFSELHGQGSQLCGQAMSALQRVLGNAGVARLHQELSALADANANVNADGGGARRPDEASDPVRSRGGP